MKFRILFLFFCLALYDCSDQSAGSTTFKSSGIGDIDRIRKEIRQFPITTENAADRRAALYRWWKFLWRQGYDLSSFNNTAQELLDTDDDSAKGRKTITRAYSEMEKIFTDPEFIPEISGTPVESQGNTNWPVYHGTNGHQTGYSPDAGPTEGKISWQFRSGGSLAGKPVLEDGSYNENQSQLGVRGRVGFGDGYDAIRGENIIYLHNPYNNEITGWIDYTTNVLAKQEYLEDQIITERARELAFEGERFYDLMRIAKRRNDPSYLADKVAAKFSGAKAEQIHQFLMIEENWYVPFY